MSRNRLEYVARNEDLSSLPATLRLNVPVCPYCGHKFISAIVWILLMAIAFVVIPGVLLFLTRS
jgi:hypothetical protein